MRDILRKLSVSGAVFLFALSMVPARAGATARAIDLDEYRDRVDAALVAVRDVPDAEPTAGEALDVVTAVVESLPTGQRVTQDGNAVTVDQSLVRGFVARLDAARDGSQRREILDELEAHLVSLRQSLGRDGASVAEDPEALAALLNSRVPPPDSALQEFFADLVDSIVEWIAGWWGPFEGVGVPSAFGRVLSVIVVVLLSVLLAWVAFVVVRRVRRGRARKPQVVSDMSASIVAAAEDVPADARAHALHLADQGDRRGAVRALFGGAARSLVEEGVVVQTRTLTNAELVREVDRGPLSSSLTSYMQGLSDIFETSWYGHHDPAGSGFSEALGIYDDVGRVLSGYEGDSDRSRSAGDLA